MTSKVEVEDTTVSHVKHIRQNLREEDRQEIIRAGFDPNRICMYTYKTALLRKTGLIDGEPVAMWGVRGNLLGLVGQPYLLTTNNIHLISSLKFARIYVKEVEEMKKLFPILENYVDANYHEAVRLLDLAGFTLSKPVYINNNTFRRFSLISD